MVGPTSPIPRTSGAPWRPRQQPPSVGPAGRRTRTAGPARPPARSVLALAAYVVGVAALAGFLVARVGRFGFNPSDQGFVLSLSRRVLEGRSRTSTSSRPDPWARPTCTSSTSPCRGRSFLVSDLVAMVQIIVSTIACAALVSGVSPLRWGPLRILLVAAAAVVNLNTFTLMAWHTIDGIFLTSVGWWLLDSGLRSGCGGPPPDRPAPCSASR